MELYVQVRRAVYVEGMSRREAARRFGIDPRTVAKMLAFSVPPGYLCSAKTFRSWHETPIAVSNFQQATSTTGGLLHHARGTELVQDAW